MQTAADVVTHIVKVHPQTKPDEQIVDQVTPIEAPLVQTDVVPGGTVGAEEVRETTAEPILPPEASAGVPTVEAQPVGRPTKYRPEYCQMVIDHMAKGYSFEAFGADVDCGKDTLYEWAKVHPEFSDAVEKGRIRSLKFWETLGMNGTVGKPNYYIDAITGKKTATDKFNSQTYALHMANKHKWVSNKTDVTTDGEKLPSPTVIIYTGEKSE